MKKITLLGSICLVVILAVMLFGACAQPAQAPVTVTITSPGSTVTVTPPAKTVTVTPPAVTTTATPGKPTFTVMDPRDSMAPIPYVALNPRLTTLVGKKIGVVNMGGGNYHALEPVADAINKAYPGVIADYLFMSDSRDATQLAWVKAHDAIILGNVY